MEDLQYRHEWKHVISQSDRIAILQRLSAVASLDPHAVNGSYLIRSLYFDNLSDRALREKLDGVNEREKFRIRYYNRNTDQIHLEKKSKRNGLGTKQQASLTSGEAQAIADGWIDWMRDAADPLIRELYLKMKNQGLRAKTIVDYTREPFVYGPGNVRVTLDYNIRTGLQCTDFLNPDCVTVPAGAGETILEVKWDAFLPGIIRDAVQLPNRQTSSFSKYAACRMYG
jgi:hypothetical protein